MYIEWYSNEERNKKMLISEAFAQTAETANVVANAPAPDGFKMIFQLILIFAILYFLLIRPQQKKIKKHQDELNAIIKGSKIIVAGIIGTVKEVKENGELTVEIADGTQVVVLREYVAGLVLTEEKGK